MDTSHAMVESGNDENDANCRNVVKSEKAAKSAVLKREGMGYWKHGAFRKGEDQNVGGRVIRLKSREEMEMEEIMQKRQEILKKRRLAERRMQMSFQGTLVKVKESDFQAKKLTVPQSLFFRTEERAMMKLTEDRALIPHTETDEFIQEEVKEVMWTGRTVPKSPMLRTKLRGDLESQKQAPQNKTPPRKVVPVWTGKPTIPKSPRFSSRSQVKASRTRLETAEEMLIKQRKPFRARPMPNFNDRYANAVSASIGATNSDVSNSAKQSSQLTIPQPFRLSAFNRKLTVAPNSQKGSKDSQRTLVNPIQRESNRRLTIPVPFKLHSELRSQTYRLSHELRQRDSEERYGPEPNSSKPFQARQLPKSMMRADPLPRQEMRPPKIPIPSKVAHHHRRGDEPEDTFAVREHRGSFVHKPPPLPSAKHSSVSDIGQNLISDGEVPWFEEQLAQQSSSDPHQAFDSIKV